MDQLLPRELIGFHREGTSVIQQSNFLYALFCRGTNLLPSVMLGSSANPSRYVSEAFVSPYGLGEGGGVQAVRAWVDV